MKKQMAEKINGKESGALLQKIATIDFDKLYHPSLRIFLHCAMWLSLSSLFFCYYYIEFQQSFTESLIFSTRTTINNMVLFYLFFYLIIPIIFTLEKWGVFFLLLCFPLSIYIWLFTNLMQFRFLHFYGFEITSEGPFKGSVKKLAEVSVLETISLESIIGNAMLVIFSYSPPFFVKILFDITRVYNKTIRYQKHNLELEVQNINIEKNFLKAQLNPHFLFNTLNNLYSLVIKKDPGAPEAIIKISEIMSYTLYESNTEKVSLEKETEFIRNYFDLEKMRASADKDLSLHIDIPSQQQQLKIAPLLTFTFVENAFKYGLDSNNSFIKISIKVADTSFHFNCENSKNAFIKDRKVNGGIGVQNIRKRLDLLYRDRYTLKIENTDDLYSVSLKIDLEHDE
jgi:sensor histidine kinase YesM